MDGEVRLGRPRICPDQENSLDTCTARLSIKDQRLARKLGGGNFSAGLREALAHAAADLEFVNKPRKQKK